MCKMMGKLGDIGQVALPLSAGCIALSFKDYKGFCLLAVAATVNQICIEILKSVTGVTRPNGRKRSFPSGHTASAFLSVGFIACRYQASQMPWTLCVYTIFALITGISRVITKNHWISDTVGGCFLGMSVSVLLIPRNSP